MVSFDISSPTKMMLCSRAARLASSLRASRFFATAATAQSPVSSASRNHKVVVIGGGTAGLSISHQLLNTGKFTQDDIAIVDPAEWHHYQPGWTLVGGGLKTKQELRRPLQSLLDPKLKHYQGSVRSFAPEENAVTLANGDKLDYEQLVVVPGIEIRYDEIKGLPEALAEKNSLVSSIYGYDTVDKVFGTIQKMKKGKALFTQPAGEIKCPGAPQKIMWLALDYWKRRNLYNPSDPASSLINIDFFTALPAMFPVPKYSDRLNEMREERGVGGFFTHDLVAIDGNTATFSVNGEEQVKKEFDLLHVVPKMGAYSFMKDSPLVDSTGFVDVNENTTRHKTFLNVWSAGDASNLPTSKTMAAITMEAPVLVRGLIQALEGQSTGAESAETEEFQGYDGYASCPLTTEYGKVMLAEFVYGHVPKESFNKWLGWDQIKPRRSFYHLKKDFFPWIYYSSLVRGTWGGPKGFL